MYLTIIKFTATVLAFIMGAFNIPFEMPGFSDEKITETTVEYLNDEAGSADAVITVKASSDGEEIRLTYSTGNPTTDFVRKKGLK